MQELSEENAICRWQPNLKSNCQLEHECVKRKVKVVVYGRQSQDYDNSSPNI